MDNHILEKAIAAGEEATNCECLSADLSSTIGVLVAGCEELRDSKENTSNIDNLREAITALREEVESAQGTLSDLDDKFGDIYSKLDEADCAIDELEG